MTEFAPLPRSFYQPSAQSVAPRLLGHWLIRNTLQGPCGGQIIETEAYLRDDPACHGSRGVTERNKVMFGPPGHAYVYFIYGVHYCVNAVCMREGIAEAVLIRAIEPALLPEFMKQRRAVQGTQELTSGPAKVCQALDIGRRLDGVDLCDEQSPLFIARNVQQRRFRSINGPVVTTPRIGITHAASLPLRFYLDRNIHVSKR